ncbi:NUDIX domain-containing protein [Ancylobacter terrae]|uniref:NUDIX domain-containing protein n=1 Tax=Ancylobacter sp. sgz301288 TaxID=3342077 RepID=UPI00385C62E1
MSRDERDRAARGDIVDRPARLTLSEPAPIGDGFRPYQRFELELAREGGSGLAQRRDILRVGNVAVVLPYDPVAGCFVLIRQFRLAAHLATGRGEIVEPVAGHIDAGESAAQAAHRECVEEIGVAPVRLMPLMAFMPTPGVTDEHAELFLAVVDSTRVPALSGASAETEETHPFLIGIEEAVAALARGAVGNGFLIIALQWFALNRARAEAFGAGG